MEKEKSWKIWPQNPSAKNNREKKYDGETVSEKETRDVEMGDTGKVK